jgi:hypothetical protein
MGLCWNRHRDNGSTALMRVHRTWSPDTSRMARIALFLTDNERCRRCSALPAILYQPWLEDRIKTLPTAKLRNLDLEIAAGDFDLWVSNRPAPCRSTPGHLWEVVSRRLRAHLWPSPKASMTTQMWTGKSTKSGFFLLRSVATKDGGRGQRGRGWDGAAR